MSGKVPEINLVFDEPVQRKKAPKHLADFAPGDRKAFAKESGFQPFRASQGIKSAIDKLVQRRASLHDAHHEVMEALGEMVWESQRSGRPFDGQGYIDRVMMRATR